ncbi:MAG: hypothetical protein KF819_41185, partial [Labilithrix sp.]|nr:hypothetical protein [Labilithrix sp.]
WSCFTCIATEHANALHDRGEDAEALAFLDQRAAELVASGKADGIYSLARSRMESLIALGRHEEALAFLAEDEKRGPDDEHHRRWRRIERARLLVRLGRADEARSALPGPDEIEATPVYFRAWADAAEHLVRAGAMKNDFRLGATLRRFVEKLARQGVGRITLELAEVSAHLALERGAPHVARRALASMEAASALLHRPLDALDRIGKLRDALARVADASLVAMPETPSLALSSLANDTSRDPERELLFLEAAAARFPDDVDVAMALAECQLASGFEKEAVANLDAFQQRIPADDVVMRLGSLLLSDPQALATLVARHHERAADDASRAVGEWLLARGAHAREEWGESRTHLDLVLAARPDAVNARLMHAEASRRLGDHRAALMKLDEAIALAPESAPAHWDLMVVATVLGEHARVRASAKRVGFDFEGEGPIDERLGLCRIRYPDETRDCWAIRTSPVTARIVEIASPPRPLRYRDVVVFDAVPLNPPPATDEERRHHAHVYPFVTTLTHGNYRAYFLDGIHPGEDVVEEITAALKAVSCELELMSSDEYEVQGQRGIFAGIALPASASEIDACAALARVVDTRQLTFAGLARAAGDEARAEKHEALAEELRL